MSDKSSELAVHRRPKSAWSSIKRRQSLAEGGVTNQDKTDFPEDSTSKVGQSNDLEKEIEEFNRMRLDLSCHVHPSRLPADQQGSKRAKCLSKNSQRLKRDLSLNFDMFKASESAKKPSENFENVIPGADYDSLDEEIESFNRSKIQNSRQRQGNGKSFKSKGPEFDSQGVIWDSLDEEIQAFNREKALDIEDLSGAPSKRKKFDRRRRSVARGSSVLRENSADDEVVLLEEITSLGREDDMHGVKGSEVTRDRSSTHAAAKRSYSDKGPSGKAVDKHASIAKYPASYNAGDLLALDFEVARRNVLERYNFYGRTDECGSVRSKNVTPQRANDSSISSNHSIRNFGNPLSINKLGREAYKSKNKLKPIKSRPNKSIGIGESPSHPSDNTDCSSNRRTMPKLLEALPKTLIIDQDQYSTPDLLTQNSIHQEHFKDVPAPRLNDMKSLSSAPLGAIVSERTSSGEPMCARGPRKHTQEGDFDLKPFAKNDSGSPLQRERNQAASINSSDPNIGPPRDQHCAPGGHPHDSVHNDLSIRHEFQSGSEASLTTHLYSFNDDWNSQSLADFWQQTKKDLGGF